MASLPFPAGYKLALGLRGFAVGPVRQSIVGMDSKKIFVAKKKLLAQLQTLLGDSVVAQL